LPLKVILLYMAPRQGRRAARPCDSSQGFPSRGQPKSQQGSSANSRGNRRSGTEAAKWREAFDLLPSISRSGGDDGEGDTMKDYKVQDRYWQTMEEKISDHWKQYPDPSVRDDQARRERESSLLLQMRKLREGILATNRKDSLALSVYESSFYLALCFNSSAQALASLPHLIDLYKRLLGEDTSASLTHIRSKVIVSCTIALALHLLEAYPSQSSYFRFFNSISHLNMDKEGQELRWLTSLRKSLTMSNFSEFGRLTGTGHIISVLDHLPPEERLLPKAALTTTMERLRSKLRDATWSIIRVSYRELSLDSGVDTPSWLSRTLMFDSNSESIDSWMNRKAQEGHVAVKEGTETRYIVRKPV